VNQLCQECHAQIQARPDAINPAICPACGGALIEGMRPNLDPPGAQPREGDHRGILLPRRHAVGGIITPR